MGDAGSTYLGAAFIGICFGQENIKQSIEIFLLASPLYADATLTLVVRFFKKEISSFQTPQKSSISKTI